MRKVLIAAAVSTVCTCTAWAVRPSAFGNQSKPLKASVQILAISSSSRQSFAGNQDVYLADVQLKDGSHRFARLVDQYPGFALPIRTSLLNDRTVFALQLTREPECDVRGAQIYLAQRNDAIFNGTVRDSLQSRADEVVPCFKTLHQTIRVPKQ